jgi:hypothetical protein
MERTNGSIQGLKKVAVALALMAAMASTGCGQNALLNPTSDQVMSAGGANLAKSTTTDSGSQGFNPAGSQGLNP